MKHKKKGAEVFFSPYDVFLDEHSNVVQPEIVFVSAENKSIIKEDAIHGIPDMLIEILSPSNADHDLFLKRIFMKNLVSLNTGLSTPKQKKR